MDTAGHPSGILARFRLQSTSPQSPDTTPLPGSSGRITFYADHAEGGSRDRERHEEQLEPRGRQHSGQGKRQDGSEGAHQANIECYFLLVFVVAVLLEADTLPAAS